MINGLAGWAYISMNISCFEGACPACKKHRAVPGGLGFGLYMAGI